MKARKGTSQTLTTLARRGLFGIEGSPQGVEQMKTLTPWAAALGELNEWGETCFAVWRPVGRGRGPQQHDAPRQRLPHAQWSEWISDAEAFDSQPQPPHNTKPQITMEAFTRHRDHEILN